MSERLSAQGEIENSGGLTERSPAMMQVKWKYKFYSMLKLRYKVLNLASNFDYARRCTKLNHP